VAQAQKLAACSLKLAALKKMRKVALVTGGSRGIGLGIAEHLAQEGYDLAINGMRPEEAVQDVVQHLQEAGGEVIY
jgi:NAD(P)-dependent dehydrogenase (short-subunit alcohol dehydrogenase family)